MSSVNRPVDLKQKEKDVNNKLQLYGIVEAFSNGKVPSNQQIDVALNSALAHRALNSPSKKLSSEGQHLVSDLKSVIEQAKILLLTKNEGNLLQDFIWQAEHLGSNSASLPNAPVDKDTAKQHGNEALDGLRTLGTLIISNGQFRKLLSDATVLLRDMAGDAAQNTANKIKPSEDRLNRLDEPAEDNTWHDTSDLNRENLRNQAKNSLPFGNKNKDEAKSDLKEHAKDINQAANPDGSRDPQHTAELGAHEGQTGQSTGINARGALETAKQKVDANTSEEDKNMARARRDQMNNYLKGKMPEERREQTIWRLKKMVVEIQGHQDYQRAIETLLSLAEQYSGHGKNLGQQGKGSVQGAYLGFLSENKWLTNLKTLLERFANNTSFDDLIESINQVYKDADQDPELKNWFTRINHFIRKTLQQQGFILEDRSNEEWNQIYDDGHRLLRGRYRGHTDRIADEFKFIGEQFDADPQNKQFAQSVNKLFLDLGQDENGQTVFKPHLLKDLSDVILPSIFENVRYVPIPRIEYSDSMVDAVVENLVIEGDNLAPNSLEFGSDNYWRWGRKSISSKNKNKVMLSVSGVQMDLRDVSYYIKRKQGFPSITDKGVMDIFMGGSGFSFKVEMETADKARENHAQTHFFKVTKVESDIKNLQIKMKKSNHKLLFNMFKPLLLKVMRPVIQKVLEKQIKDSANQLDGILFDIKTEADRAEAEAKRNPDPQNLQNMYQRYASAMQHRVMQGKQKKEQVKEKASDTQVNMAVTQHDSIFKNISLPGGISSKATEYKELAAKGERWESPIFSIGSAKETSSLPQVGKVTRKPHGRAGGYGSPGDESRGLGASQGLNPSANQYDSQYSNAGGLGAGQGLTSGQGLTGGSGLAGGQGLTGGVPSTTGGSHGFGTQVDDAFNTSGTGAPVGSSGLGSSGLGSSGLDSTGLNNPAATTTGSTTHPTGAPASGEFNTTFGDQNPVFQGRA
ncbi:lipid binding protein [Alternaria alternata]|nr:lipid binding protein [Alternaria alternata]